jgi:hypothetical protein
VANDYQLGSLDTASSTPGQMSALDFGGFNSGWGGPSTIDTSTTDLSNVGGGDLSSVGSATGVPSVDSTAGNVPSGSDSSGGSWWQNLLGGVGSTLAGVGSNLAGVAPYAGVAAIGLNQAKATQKQNEARAKQLADLGGPYTAAGQALLKQFQAGQIRPDQQAVADLAKTSGQTLIDSGSGLSAIAQSAYKDYQAGKLPQADEQRLADQTASQKQQLRARLGNITDSSILAGYDAQIDNQANINRQDLLDKRFATGNQAYDEWLKSTTEGQQLKLQGAEFASKALDNMLSQSLSLSAEGMQPVEASIQLAMQSDTQLSSQVNELMGNLAAAYAYTASGPGRSGSAGGGAGAAGGAGSLMKSIIGTGKSLYSGYESLFGASTAASAGSAVAGLGADLAASTATAEAGVAADVAASNSAWLASSAAAGSEAAGGAAAGGAAAAGGEAAAGEGVSAGALGAGAGALSAAGIFAIPAILASTVKQHGRDAAQYASMLSDLNQGPSSPGYNATIMEIAADIASGRTQEYPAEVLQKAQQLGLYQTASSLSAYKGPVGQGGPATSRNKQ